MYFFFDREEEVQALIRYIYTGQLSASVDQGSGWEKIIDDFKVGIPLDSDDFASIHEVLEYEEEEDSLSVSVCFTIILQLVFTLIIFY